MSNTSNIAYILRTNPGSINDRDHKGRTPLMLACQDNYNQKVLSLLLSSRHVDLNAVDNCGNNALFYTLADSSLNKSKLTKLIQKGCSLSARNTCCNATVFHLLYMDKFDGSYCNQCKRLVPWYQPGLQAKIVKQKVDYLLYLLTDDGEVVDTQQQISSLFNESYINRPSLSQLSGIEYNIH